MSGRFGLQRAWGTLTILLQDGSTLSCDYIADVGHACSRILHFRQEYTFR